MNVARTPTLDDVLRLSRVGLVIGRPPLHVSRDNGGFRLGENCTDHRAQHETKLCGQGSQNRHQEVPGDRDDESVTEMRVYRFAMPNDCGYRATETDDGPPLATLADCLAGEIPRDEAARNGHHGRPALETYDDPRSTQIFVGRVATTIYADHSFVVMRGGRALMESDGDRVVGTVHDDRPSAEIYGARRSTGISVARTVTRTYVERFLNWIHEDRV